MTENNSKAHSKLPGNLSLTTIIILASLLIALLALLLSVLAIKANIDTKGQVTSFTQNQNAEFAAIKNSQEQAESSIRQFMAKEETDLRDLQQQLTQNRATLAQNQVRSLIRLASLELNFFDNIESAIRLLQLAFTQLSEFNGSAIALLKNNIMTDIKKLQQLPKVNKIPVLLTINALEEKIQTVAIIPDIKSQNPQPNTTPVVKHDWWQTTKNSLSSFKSLVTIRKIEDPNSLILSPDNILTTKQQLIFKLNQAKWAVLNNENACFQQDIQDSLNSIARLPIKPQEKDALLTTLNSLRKITLYHYRDIHLSSLSTTEDS